MNNQCVAASIVGAVVSVTEVAKTRCDVLGIFEEDGIDGASDDFDLRVDGEDVLQSFFAGDEIDEGNVVFVHADLKEFFDCFDDGAASCNHGVEEEDFAVLDSFREFRVVEDGSFFLGGFVALEQDLADVDVGEHLKQFMQEAVACAHDCDGDEIVLISLEFRRIVETARRFASHFCDFLLVERGFDEHAHDSVGVVAELRGGGRLISNLRVDELSLRNRKHSDLGILGSDRIQLFLREEFQVRLRVQRGLRAVHRDSASDQAG